MTEIKLLLEQIFNNVASLGYFGPLAFILIFVIGTTFFCPTAVLTLAAGALFGAPIGSVVALVASMMAASAGFLSGRYMSKGWVQKKVALNKRLMKLDALVSKKGWKIVLLLRLSAIFPFMLLNYGLGLSNIRFKHYFLATLIGSIPGTVLYVYLGSLAGRMVFEQNQLEKTPAEWVMIAIGVVATIVMGIYSATIIKKSLK